MDPVLGPAAIYGCQRGGRTRRYVQSAAQSFKCQHLTLVYSGEGWTRVQGFYTIMGGYHIYSVDEHAPPYAEAVEPYCPLDKVTVVAFSKLDRIKLLTEEEIQDRGKSDWLAKTLVLLQTTWFVIQCIVRGAAHMPLAKLEIITLAYTIITVGINIAWWDKPRNVKYPTRIMMLKSEIPQREDVKKSNWIEILLRNLLPSDPPGLNVQNLKCVPTFYTGQPPPQQYELANIITLSISVLFGVVHCLAWLFPFSSAIEKTLWRVFSVMMTAVPASILLAFGMLEWSFRRTKSKMPRHVQRDNHPEPPFFFHMVHFLAYVIGGPLYLAARVGTFVIALKSLTSLPYGSFQTIPWTKLIPHL
jgi:hypothetical protein